MLKKFFSNKNALMYTIVIACLLVFIAVFSLVTVLTPDSSRVEYNLKEDGTYEVKDVKNMYRGGIFMKKKLVIPNEHNGKKVTSIAKINSEYIKEIELEEGIETIDGGAFGGMKLLETITIPTTVKSVGKEAFKNCSALDNVVLPEGLTEISIGTFLKCYSLKNITIPTTIETIKEGAFEGCTALETFVVTSNIKTIENKAFYGCTNLKNVTLEFNNVELGAQVFAKTAFELDNSVNGFFAIDNELYGYAGNEKYVVVPSNITKIKEGAFSENETIERVTLPNSVLEIEERSFSSSLKLKALVFDGNCKINSKAFEGSNNLKTLCFTFQEKDLSEETKSNLAAFGKMTNVFENAEGALVIDVYLTKDDKTNNITSNYLFDLDVLAAYRLNGETKEYFDQSKYKFYKLVNGKKEYINE